MATFWSCLLQSDPGGLTAFAKLPVILKPLVLGPQFKTFSPFMGGKVVHCEHCHTT